MKKRDFSSWSVMLTLSLVAVALPVAWAEQEGRGTVQQEVEQVVVAAYIQGIHGTQDETQVKAGFHESFRMLVLDGEGIRAVSVEEWLQSIEASKIKNPKMWKARTTYQFDAVDVADNAASVKIRVFKDKKHFSTDYMLLYRFADGWKIVSKIFKMY